MRILEATDFYYPWIAGPAPFISNLSSGLTARGHDVVIACPSPSGKRYDEPRPPKRHRVRTISVPFGYRLRAGFPVLDMARLVREFQPDVVHVHHPFPISIAAMLIAKSRSVPVVATNHTIPECTLFGLKQNWLYGPASAALSTHIKLVLSGATTVTTPTATAAGFLAGMGYKREVLAISNGVDTDRFRPATRDPDPEKPPIVLYTGRLDDDKDMETFVRAIPFVLERTHAQFRIGGEGTDKPRLERMVAGLGLTGSVTFTGYVDEAELPDVYQAADVYAISSQVELQSISTLEAMASGLPVVAADAGALLELVQTGVNGFLVPPADARKFGNAIADVLEDAGRRRHFGLRSRETAERHSVRAMIDQYERLFQRVALRPAPEAVYGTAGG